MSGVRLGALFAALALGSVAMCVSQIGQPMAKTSARQFEEKDAENGVKAGAHGHPWPFGPGAVMGALKARAWEHAAHAARNHTFRNPFGALTGARKDAERAMEHTAGAAGNQTRHGPCPWAMEHAAFGARNHGPCPWASEHAAGATENQRRHGPCPWVHPAHGARNQVHHGPCPWASEMGALQHATNGTRNITWPNSWGAAKDAENGVNAHANFHPFGAMGAMMGNHTHQIPWAARMGAMDHGEAAINENAVAAIMDKVKERREEIVGAMEHATNGTTNHTPHFPFAAEIGTKAVPAGNPKPF